MKADLAAFRELWLPRLNRGASALLFCEDGPVEVGLHTAIADEFVSRHGFQPIGFNWELLDASPEAQGKRAARTQLVEAFSKDIANPSRSWLSDKEAEECADAFLALFDPDTLTLVANRYDGLWNPISPTHDQWAYVAFDAERIALLLLAAE